MTTTFATMPVQDLARAPLRSGEELGVGVSDLLHAATGRNGSGKFGAFKQRIVRATGEAFVMPNGVVLHKRLMLNGCRPVNAVSLSQVPLCLSLMLNMTEARDALVRPELIETLVRHGMAEEAATLAIEDAMARVYRYRDPYGDFHGGEAYLHAVRDIYVPGPHGAMVGVITLSSIVTTTNTHAYATAQRVVYTLYEKHNEDAGPQETTAVTLSEDTLLQPMQLETAEDAASGSGNIPSPVVAFEETNSGVIDQKPSVYKEMMRLSELSVQARIVLEASNAKSVKAKIALEAINTQTVKAEAEMVKAEAALADVYARFVAAAMDEDTAAPAVVDGEEEFIYARASVAYHGHIKIGITRKVAKRLSPGNTFCAMAPYIQLCITRTLDSKRDVALARTFFAKMPRVGEFFKVSAEAVRAYFQDVIGVRFAHEEAELLGVGVAATVKSEDEESIQMEDHNDPVVPHVLQAAAPLKEEVPIVNKKRRMTDMEDLWVIHQDAPTRTSDGQEPAQRAFTVGKSKMSKIKYHALERDIAAMVLKFKAFDNLMV